MILRNPIRCVGVILPELIKVWRLAWLVITNAALGAEFPGTFSTEAPGVEYKNFRIAEVPWSIHVIRLERARFGFEMHSAHARNRAIGLGTLSEQITLLNRRGIGAVVAGINGDFYQRDSSFAGDPRGLQIFEGDLISAPSGGASLWIDSSGEPHATNVFSEFTVTWPNGTKTPFDVNGDRRGKPLQLYTRMMGATTRTGRGRELLLETTNNAPWEPLRIGKTYLARVREIREAGNSPLAAETMVLSLNPSIQSTAPGVSVGESISISMDSIPNLEGAKTAIGGGPMVVHNGKPQKLSRSGGGGYETSSMAQRHPRSAVGWNKSYYYLVEVDGRQDGSVGMTLSELGDFMAKLGCEEGMNLDGGGSATIWCTGKVRNDPSDGQEREIANSLIVVRTPTSAQK